MAEGMEIALQGLDILRKGLESRANRRAAKEEKSAELQKVQEKVKAVADLVRGGGLPFVAEEDREPFAKAVEAFGESSFSKVLAIGLGDKIPVSAQEMFMQGFYKNYLGKKSGDQDAQAAGTQLMTDALEATTAFTSAQTRGRELGKISLGGAISKSGASKGVSSELVPQVITGPDGNPVTIQVDKRILQQVDRDLRKMDKSTKESLANKAKTKPGEVAAKRIQEATSSGLRKGETVTGALGSATGGLADQYLKEKQKALRSNILYEAVNAGYGKVVGEADASSMVPKPKGVSKSIQAPTPTISPEDAALLKQYGGRSK